MLLDDFFPFVLVDILGCPDPTLRQSIRSAASEFCRETLSWTEMQDPVPLVDGVSSYDMDGPSQALVHMVRDVWVNNRRLRPMTLQGMQDVMPNWSTATANEPIYYNAAADRNAIRVFPTPANTTGQTLVVRAANVPTFGATVLPDFLGYRWMEVIASGAKSRLMMLPGFAWTNPPLAAYHQQMFANGITQARIEEAHDRVPGTITVRPRSFGF